MKNQKMYEADDKMISIIRDNYNILQSLGSFGINLGFGDKTVREVCDEQNVDTYTFLAVVNFTINGYCIISRHPMSIILISSCLSSVRNSLRLWMKQIIWHVLSSNFMMIMPIV